MQRYRGRTRLPGRARPILTQVKDVCFGAVERELRQKLMDAAPRRETLHGGSSGGHER